MKKPVLYFALIVTFMFLSMSGFSQSPDFFNYQAIARDASANPITNTSVDVDITIRQGSTGGPDVFTESHTVITNDYGLIIIQIGNGSGAQNLVDVDWSAGPYFLKVDIDNEEMSNTQLISVPYSKYASAAGNGITSVQNENWDDAFSWGDHALEGYSPLTNDWTRDNDTLYYIDGNIGVGTKDPQSTLSVYGSTPNDSAIFEVKNNLGRQVFAVYNEGVRITIDETYSKGPKGGFAIGGFDNVKGDLQNYLTVNADSTRIYVKDDDQKGPKGGFAIGGFDNTEKGILFNFVDLTPENYFIGHESGSNITTGLYNSFLGYQAGVEDTSGSYNLFLGYKAGNKNLAGHNNVFVGFRAGYSNIGGAGYGSNNVFVGNNAGYDNIMGYGNVFLGDRAGLNNERGNGNIYIGELSGSMDSTGSNNVYIGHYAGANAQKGETTSNGWNVAIGGYSGQYLKGTGGNAFLGYDAGRYTTTGNQNTFVGQGSGKQNQTGIFNVYIGNGAGELGTENKYNTFIGESAGGSITFAGGNYNTFVGSGSGGKMTEGYGNSFLGKESGENRGGGYYNVLLGMYTGENSGSGWANTMLGTEAGRESDGAYNVFLGYKAGYNESGSDKLYISNSDAIGDEALVYGEFDNRILQINGQVGIGGAISAGDSLHVHGNIRITGGSFIDDGTTIIADYVYGPDYKLESIEEHSDFMWTNKHLPAIKSADEIEQEGGYDISLRREQILEELEKAHIYIDQLNNKIKNLEEENAEMKEIQTEILSKIEELSTKKK